MHKELIKSERMYILPTDKQRRQSKYDSPRAQSTTSSNGKPAYRQDPWCRRTACRTGSSSGGWWARSESSQWPHRNHRSYCWSLSCENIDGHKLTEWVIYNTIFIFFLLQIINSIIFESRTIAELRQKMDRKWSIISSFLKQNTTSQISWPVPYLDFMQRFRHKVGRTLTMDSHWCSDVFPCPSSLTPCEDILAWCRENQPEEGSVKVWPQFMFLCFRTCVPSPAWSGVSTMSIMVSTTSTSWRSPSLPSASDKSMGVSSSWPSTTTLAWRPSVSVMVSVSEGLTVHAMEDTTEAIEGSVRTSEGGGEGS